MNLTLCAALSSQLSVKALNDVTRDSAFPFDGFVAEGAAGTHDPAVTEFNGAYLCFTTGPGLGMLRQSANLTRWKEVGPVIAPSPEWVTKAVSHSSVWAPEASKFGTGLRLYYSVSARFGHNDSWIGLAECPNFSLSTPAEGWRDLGPLLSSRDGVDKFNAIDPDLLADQHGRQWLFFGSYWSGIYVCELDAITGKPKDATSSGRTLVACNKEDRNNGLEAPCCIFHDGYYYLFVNYGLAAQGVRSTYKIVVGRSTSPSGPFFDSSGKSMVEGGHENFLDSSPPMFGPGGGVAFKDSKGRWLISYHFYDSRRYWRNHMWGVPTLQIREILWDAQKWPAPGLPISPETAALDNQEAQGLAGKWLHQADFGAVQTLEIKDDGSCILGNRERGSWTRSGRQVTFHWPKPDAPGESWDDEVVLANSGHYFVGRNQLRMIVRAVRVENDSAR